MPRLCLFLVHSGRIIASAFQNGWRAMPELRRRVGLLSSCSVSQKLLPPRSDSLWLSTPSTVLGFPRLGHACCSERRRVRLVSWPRLDFPPFLLFSPLLPLFLPSLRRGVSRSAPSLSPDQKLTLQQARCAIRGKNGASLTSTVSTRHRSDAK